jgi:hypothetical protein
MRVEKENDHHQDAKAPSTAKANALESPIGIACGDAGG